MHDDRDLGHVLVVDDDENVLRLLAIKLKRAGATVDLAADLGSALARARKTHPDLVVAGDTLPDGDAGALAATLTGAGGHLRPGFVWLSARRGAEEIRQALQSGADDVVLKPFSPDELIHRLQVVRVRRQLAAPERG